MPRLDSQAVLAALHSGGILPLFYHADAGVTIEVMKAAYRAGLRVFEFTNRGSEARTVFSALTAYTHAHLPDMAVGIGTIYDEVSARAFIAAGADFVVTPVLNPGVGLACADAGLAWVPGVATLTEIYNARQAGAEVVKLFPGEVVGPAFLKAVRGPMPDLKIMVTGGVRPTLDSLREWFEAGAYCVGMGSHLFPPALLAARDYSQIEQLISQCGAYVRQLRQS